MVEKEDMMEPEMNKDDVDSNTVVATEGNSARLLGQTGTVLASEATRLENAVNAEAHEGLAHVADTQVGDNLGRSLDMNICYQRNLESTAENLQEKGSFLPEEANGEEVSPLRCHRIDRGGSCRYQRKGDEKEKEKEKEKALSDGNIDGRTLKDINNNDEDESFGSVESCNSAGVISRGKKRPSFEHLMISGRKRLKMKIQEYQGSTSKLGQDSSFMNWISNMMKGFWQVNDEEENPPTLALTVAQTNDCGHGNADQQFTSSCRKEDNESKNTGFHSFFQSIYYPKSINHDGDVATDAYAMPLSCHGKVPNFQEQLLITNENIVPFRNEVGVVAEDSVSHGQAVSFENRRLCIPESCSKEAKGLHSSLMDGKHFVNRNMEARSLWISRFSSRNSCLQSKEIGDRINSGPTKSSSIKTTITNYVAGSVRLESSEALDSIFARRLDAIKHIIPSKLPGSAPEGSATTSCYYCGETGHNLRDCSELTDTELKDLMRNINDQIKRDEGSGLCIRCFQITHWAASCPNAPQNKTRTQGNLAKLTEGEVNRCSLAPISHKQMSFHDQAEDAPKAIFDAVRMLRMSRTDIVNWMNSKRSLADLEGFFLRLRLSKCEEELGGTGYYVACITGAMEDQTSPRQSENSLSAKVGRMTCLVESRYVSNKGFLEEELSAWWRATTKGGGCAVSEEELTRKIQKRKMLGF